MASGEGVGRLFAPGALTTDGPFPEHYEQTESPLNNMLSKTERNPANQHTPIFLAHGTEDPVVPLQRAIASREQLQALGYQVDWHQYPMPHSVCPDEVADIDAFLKRVLATA